ncbi:hypothetical protein [Rhizobium sp. CF142]|uniref:hypothetical protein n=1 Tax=Rhizobium sp. CF142 TaxID=1144314 RepID=UPI0012F63E17|nr:hypothetical protein [Rhizobium sp. CF142]
MCGSMRVSGFVSFADKAVVVCEPSEADRCGTAILATMEAVNAMEAVFRTADEYEYNDLIHPWRAEYRAKAQQVPAALCRGWSFERKKPRSILLSLLALSVAGVRNTRFLRLVKRTVPRLAA